MPVKKGPIIGVLAFSEVNARCLFEILRKNGGDPWMILPDMMLSADEICNRLEALVVSSWPVQVEQSNLDEIGVVLPTIKVALERDLPLLTVGNGMHILNQWFGGDIGNEVHNHEAIMREGNDVSAYHRIYISPGSKLAAVVGSGGFVRVNSRHKRGIRDIHKSPLLLASAYSVEDGVIEALESPNHDWVIGVQFQPERRLEMPPHFDRLFKSLVERAV